jgi:hypothetical protein
MKISAQSLALGFVLALALVPSLNAQAPAKPPVYNSAPEVSSAPPDTAAANSSSQNPTTPAGQAPDDVMKRLSDLVHAGKYAEAQQSVSALLILYPDDHRLIKARTLLEQALASSRPTDNAGSAHAPADAVTSPAPDAAPEKYSGMDKVDYEALKDLARQAQQTTDLSQQGTLLKQFMDQSAAFLQKHPDEMLLWQLRAASAINLNDPTAGFEAGHKLLAAGAVNSNDANSQQMLARLKNKGWLTEQGVAEAKRKIEEDKKYGWLLGTWTGTDSWFQTAAFDYGKRQNVAKVDFVKSGPNILGYLYHMNTNTRATAPAFLYTVPNSDEPARASDWKFSTSGGTPKWQPIDAFILDNDKSTMEIDISYQKTKLIFKKAGDVQDQ